METKILTTDNLKDIKKYTTANTDGQNMTLDELLSPNNKEKLLNVMDSPTGGTATDQNEDKTLKGEGFWEENTSTSTYKKFQAGVSNFNNGYISPIPMYLKRENMDGRDGTNGGTGNKGYTGCQYAASYINYNSSLGQLTFCGIYNDFSENLSPQTAARFTTRNVEGWLKRNYPNKTFAELPTTINTGTI